MQMLLYLARHVGWWLLLALVASLISGFSNASLLALINQSLHATSSQLPKLGWHFLLLALLMLSTRMIAETLFMTLGQRAKATLRNEVVERISEASYPALEKIGMSRAISVLTQDLDTIVVFFVNLPNLVIYGAVILGCLVYLGTLSWTILLLALAVIFLGSLGYVLSHSRALQLLRSSRRREDTLIQQFKTLFDGARELKLNPLRRRRFVRGPLAENIESVRQERTRGYVLYALATSWGSVLFFAFIGCVLYLLRGYLPVNPEIMTGYTMVFLYMIVPVEGLLSALPNISSARVALQRIRDVESVLPPEAHQPPVSSPYLHSLTLQGISHHYQGENRDERFTLGPLDLHFSPGEVVFLVGGNGSGKTTLAKVLVGLYPPETGTLTLNGQHITAENLEAYRQHFAVVFNDFYLFDSVDDASARSDEQVNHLLRLLQLDHKVTVNNGQFSTIALSQGQRKRLALLLAWLEDRPFYLFDEWAADQDPTFKAVFYQQLLPLLKAEGKTVLAITHDDRYFPLADRIIKLEFGQLIAETETR
ncbi:putative ATP-binding cassette transporter [Paramixta manurensis]|uniref:ABC-type xenobiotic transporter n=1 Tax=Paramixta manurensis TaxID=2740817 RepID=A0A6M8UBM6_9GAMM|nr:putative ATP-binding cassette transporter [Erwiniaceae bacterium PD-1]